MTRAAFVGALALVLVLPALPGCDENGDPLPSPWTLTPPDDDDDRPACPGTAGDPDIEFIADDESHTELEHGAEFVIERRPQGDVTIFTPLLFEGLPGGTIVDDFAIVFTAEDGEQLGARRSTRFQLPCEEDGDVAAHYYEVFFGDPSIPASTYGGLTGRLIAQMRTPDGVTVSDSLDGVLRAL